MTKSKKKKIISNLDFHKAKIKQNVENLYFLGYTYYNGKENIKSDYRKSFKYYHLAAKKGHPEAQLNVGIMYDYGEGVVMNKKKALKWYYKSASQNNPIAQFNIGKSFDLNICSPLNEIEATKWYIESANNGHAEAECNLALKYEFGKGGLEENYFKALDLYGSSANKGCSEAQFNLGYIFFEGEIVQIDLLRSLYWFQKAANQNDEKAKHYVELIQKENSKLI